MTHHKETHHMKPICIHWTLALTLFLILGSVEILAGFLWYLPNKNMNEGECQIVICPDQISSIAYVILDSTNLTSAVNFPPEMNNLCHPGDHIKCYYDDQSVNSTLTLQSNEENRMSALTFIIVISPILCGSIIYLVTMSLCWIFGLQDKSDEHRTPKFQRHMDVTSLPNST